MPTYYDSIIEAEAKRAGVDPNLIRAIVENESAGDTNAVSPKGARGLMQLMPDTARDLGVRNLHDPLQNIRGGVRYIKNLLVWSQGDPDRALTAYHAGYGSTAAIGPLTKAYVARVIKTKDDLDKGTNPVVSRTGLASVPPSPGTLDDFRRQLRADFFVGPGTPPELVTPPSAPISRLTAPGTTAALGKAPDGAHGGMGSQEVYESGDALRGTIQDAARLTSGLAGPPPDRLFFEDQPSMPAITPGLEPTAAERLVPGLRAVRVGFGQLVQPLAVPQPAPTEPAVPLKHPEPLYTPEFAPERVPSLPESAARGTIAAVAGLAESRGGTLETIGSVMGWSPRPEVSMAGRGIKAVGAKIKETTRPILEAVAPQQAHQRDIVENWKINFDLLGDLNWWAYTLPNTAVSALSFVATGSVGGPLAAAADESLMEAGETWNRAKEAGLSDGDAVALASGIFVANMLLVSPMAIRLFGSVPGTEKVLSKAAEVVQKVPGAKAVSRIWESIPDVLKAMEMEGGQEILQDVSQTAAERTYNPEAKGQPFTSGLMGVVGGGVMHTGVRGVGRMAMQANVRVAERAAEDLRKRLVLSRTLPGMVRAEEFVPGTSPSGRTTVEESRPVPPPARILPGVVPGARPSVMRPAASIQARTQAAQDAQDEALRRGEITEPGQLRDIALRRGLPVESLVRMSDAEVRETLAAQEQPPEGRDPLALVSQGVVGIDPNTIGPRYYSIPADRRTALFEQGVLSKGGESLGKAAERLKMSQMDLYLTLKGPALSVAEGRSLSTAEGEGRAEAAKGETPVRPPVAEQGRVEVGEPPAPPPPAGILKSEVETVGTEETGPLGATAAIEVGKATPPVEIPVPPVVYHAAPVSVEKFDVTKVSSNQIAGVYFSTKTAPEWGGGKRPYLYEVKFKEDTRLAPPEIATKVAVETMGEGKNWGKLAAEKLRAMGYDGAQRSEHELVLFNVDKIDQYSIVRSPEGGSRPVAAEAGPAGEVPRDAPVDRPALRPVAGGAEGVAYTPDNQSVTFRYALVEADQPIVSHDTALNLNPDYQKELQPRKETAGDLELRVSDIVNNFTPELVGENPNAGHGAPMLGEDGQTEGGNARITAIRRIYQNPIHAQKRDAYRKFITDNAAKFGLDPQSVASAKQPILIRIRKSGVPNRAEFAKTINVSVTKEMSATEKAMADTRAVSEIISLFNPDEDGGITAFTNAEFIRRFLQSVPANERTALAPGGKLGDSGIRRVRNAVFSYLYGDPAAIGRLAERSGDDTAKHVTAAMVKAAADLAAVKSKVAQGTLAPALDIAPHIAEAANKLSALKDMGHSVDEYLQQIDPFDKTSDLAKAVLKNVFSRYGRSGKKIAQAFKYYAELAQQQGDPRQVGLFGSGQIASPETLLTAAIEKVEGEPDAQTTIFGEGETSAGSRVASVSPPATPGRAPDAGQPAVPQRQGPQPADVGEPADLTPERPKVGDTVYINGMPYNYRGTTDGTKATLYNEKSGAQIAVPFDRLDASPPTDVIDAKTAAAILQSGRGGVLPKSPPGHPEPTEDESEDAFAARLDVYPVGAKITVQSADEPHFDGEWELKAIGGTKLWRKVGSNQTQPSAAFYGLDVSGGPGGGPIREAPAPYEVARAVRRPVRPGIVMPALDEIPAPTEYIAKGQYNVDEHQRLFVNLAWTGFDRGNKAFLLADGTGMGKSREGILLAYLYARKTGKPSLIITQSQQIIDGSYREDAVALGVPILAGEGGISIPSLFSPDAVAQSPVRIGTYNMLRDGRIGGGEYGLVIFDEAHNLKNLYAAKTAAAKGVNAEKRVYATATPMDSPQAATYFFHEITGKSEATIQSLLGFELVPEVRGDRVVQVPRLTENHRWEDVIHNIVKMRDEAIRNFGAIRREYPFFGEFKVQSMPMGRDLADEQLHIENYWDEKIQKVPPGPVKRQLAGERLQELSRWVESKKVPHVLEQLKKDLEAGRSVVVVAETVNPQLIKALKRQDPGFIGAMAEALDGAGIKFSRIYGDNPKSAEIANFQSGRVRVALATPQSGGAGVNLDDTTGDRPRSLYVVTSPYSGDVFDQLLGRVSRRNTKSPAQVRLIHFTNSTSDIRRSEIIDRKLDVLRRIQRGDDPDLAGLEQTRQGEGGGLVREPEAPYSTEPEMAPAFYSAVRRAVEQRMGGAASPQGLKAMLEKTPGVKPEEMEDTGLGAWLDDPARGTKVKREDVLAYLDENAVRVEVKMRRKPAYTDEERRILAGTYVQRETDRMKYTPIAYPVAWHPFVDVVTNPREMLLTLPRVESSKITALRDELENVLALPLHAKYEGEDRTIAYDRLYKEFLTLGGTPKAPTGYIGGHYSEVPNTVASALLADVDLGDGKKTLLVNETQSDWHMEGRKEGYNPITKLPDGYRVSQRKNFPGFEGPRKSEWSVFDPNGRVVIDPAINYEISATNAEIAEAAGIRVLNSMLVPNAPLKRSWSEQVFKRVIRYAAENGYTQIAWPTGEQITGKGGRYDVGKELDEDGIKWFSGGGRRVLLRANAISGKSVLDGHYDLDKLDTVIPKGVAQQIVDAFGRGERKGQIKGDNLRVGGEWAANLYDKTIPWFLNKYGKQWGARVGEGTLPRGQKTTFRSFTQDEIDGISIRDASQVFHLHTFPITDSMRDDVMQKGQALYERRQEYGSGQRIPSQEQMGAKDVEDNRVVDRGQRPVLGGHAPEELDQQVLESLDRAAEVPASVKVERLTTPKGKSGTVEKIGKTLEDKIDPVKFVGHRVLDIRDIAVVGQLARSPLVENFVVYLVDKKTREIADIRAWSSRLPSAVNVPFLKSPSEIVSWGDALLGKENWAVAFSHNHPGGTLTASYGDRLQTIRAGRLLGDRFVGHVIINGGKFAIVGTDGKTVIEDLPTGTIQNYTAEEGDTITSPRRLAEIGKQLQIPNKGIALLLTDQASGSLRGVHIVPSDLMQDPEAFADRVLELVRSHGADRVFAYGSPDLMGAAQPLIKNGTILDYVTTEPQYRSLSGQGTLPDRGMYMGQPLEGYPTDRLAEPPAPYGDEDLPPDFAESSWFSTTPAPPAPPARSKRDRDLRDFWRTLQGLGRLHPDAERAGNVLLLADNRMRRRTLDYETRIDAILKAVPQKELPGLFRALDKGKVAATEPARAAQEKIQTMMEKARTDIIATMRAFGWEVADDWGIDGAYLPHLYPGHYLIYATPPGGGERRLIDSARTGLDARMRVRHHRGELAEGTTFTWDAKPINNPDITRLPSTTLDRLTKGLSEAMAADPAEVRRAAQGILGTTSGKTKSFWSLLHRTGKEGYSDDLRLTLHAYFNGLTRWQELSEANRQFDPLVASLEAQYPNLASALKERFSHVWGEYSETTRLLDATLERIPGVSEVMEPYALNRWLSYVRSGTAVLMLTNPGFHIANTLQLLQTLYPIVTTRELAHGVGAFATPTGQRLLARHGVSAAGKYSEGRVERRPLTEKLSNVIKFIPPLVSERRNQEIAFLTLYHKARKESYLAPYRLLVPELRFLLDDRSITPESIAQMDREAVLDASAAIYARLHGQFRSQFMGSRADQMQFVNTPIKQTVFMFRRFSAKEAELALDLIKGQQFEDAPYNLKGGRVLAMAKMVIFRTLLSGLKWGAVLAGAGAAKGLWDKVEEEWGEVAADIVIYGISSLVGLDMSGRFAVLRWDHNKNLPETLGELVTGPSVSPAIGISYEFMRPEKTGEDPAPGVIAGGARAGRYAMERYPLLRFVTGMVKWAQGDHDLDTPGGMLKARRGLWENLAYVSNIKTLEESKQQDLLDAALGMQEMRRDLKARIVNALASDNPKSADELIRQANALGFSPDAEDLKRAVDEARHRKGMTQIERRAVGVDRGLRPMVRPLVQDPETLAKWNRSDRDALRSDILDAFARAQDGSLPADERRQADADYRALIQQAGGEKVVIDDYDQDLKEDRRRAGARPGKITPTPRIWLGRKREAVRRRMRLPLKEAADD